MNKFLKTGLSILVMLFFLLMIYKVSIEPGTTKEETEKVTSEFLSSDTTNDSTTESAGSRGETALSSSEENGKEDTGKDKKADDEFILPDYDYGEKAYAYVKYIDEKFPFRVTGNPKYKADAKNACGKWLKKTMESFGYKAVVQKFGHDDGETKVKVTSYVFNKKGKSKKRIVIGAHYDSRESHGAEDNGTGMGMVLELAERFAKINTDLSLEFCFWDGEELRGYAGSYYYVKTCKDPENIELYINLDCLGVGDEMFVYGGRYEGKKLVQAEALDLTFRIGEALGLPLSKIPKLKEPEFKTPTRLTGSDQHYFAEAKIPYLYFEANAWVDEAGVEQYPNGNMSYQYNTKDPALKKTEGQINHTEFDTLETLEKIFPGRMQDRLTKYSKILTVLLMELAK